ncbi:MAG: response regulator transcription factor [Spirochaetaceae bacterium]|jgi:DNA-binding response OmpR family regulator|nr:response regulator transcription factor [Spirochaetaceae bacterium]
MQGKQSVLVIDDEEKILSLIKSYLEINGYAAFCANNGREGMELFEKHQISLILLDLMLPDFSGEEFCRRIRQASDVPIIMITAKVEEENIINGLNIGADDYVTKPFSPRQLMARIQAVLRRGSSDRGKTRGLLSCGDLAVDTEKRIVSRNGEELALTRDEYSILTLLMSRQAKIFTREEILEAIKGDDYDGFDRSIDSHIKRLRAKIGDDPRAPRYILTVYGMGYRLGDTQNRRPAGDRTSKPVRRDVQ